MFSKFPAGLGSSGAVPPGNMPTINPAYAPVTCNEVQLELYQQM